MKHKNAPLFLITVVTLGILGYFEIIGYYNSNRDNDESCHNIMHSPLLEDCPFRAILIDLELLKSQNFNSAHRPKVAVLAELSDVVIKNHYKDTYDIIYYKDEDDRSYWKFYDNVTRIVPKMKLTTVGCFAVPEDTKKFEQYWRRSELISCLNLNMNRPNTTSYLPIDATILAMTKLQNLLVSMNMYPFLCGGSLLGWYRECGLIPHTQDVDFAVPIEQHTPKLVEYLKSDRSKFRLKRELGAIFDGYELTVRPKMSSRPFIDIFFLYSEGNSSWLGGTSPDGSKFRYSYPRYDRWCAADLYGHLYWVACNPQEVLEGEYGKGNWLRDHKTSQYSWSSSGKNVKKVGKWPKSKLKDVYKTY